MKKMDRDLFPRKEGVFQAYSVTAYMCDCGCGCLKMLALDEDDNVGAEISFQPKTWLEDLMPQMEAQCRKMLGIAPQ